MGDCVSHPLLIMKTRLYKAKPKRLAPQLLNEIKAKLQHVIFRLNSEYTIYQIAEMTNLTNYEVYSIMGISPMRSPRRLLTNLKPLAILNGLWTEDIEKLLIQVRKR